MKFDSSLLYIFVELLINIFNYEKARTEFCTVIVRNNNFRIKPKLKIGNHIGLILVSMCNYEIY